MSELRNVVTPDQRRIEYLASGAWDGTTLPGRVAAHARERPDARAVLDEHGAHLTYGDLWAGAASVAGFLVDEDIGAGDVVSVQLPNCLETAVVARFTGKTSLAGRVGTMPGAELRQALSCKLGLP